MGIICDLPYKSLAGRETPPGKSLAGETPRESRTNCRDVQETQREVNLGSFTKKPRMEAIVSKNFGMGGDLSLELYTQDSTICQQFTKLWLLAKFSNNSAGIFMTIVFSLQHLL